MRYCKKCGNQLSDDMLFCQKCGTKVEAAAKEERPAATYPVLENIENTPTKQKAKNKNGARVFGIIALILIVIIFIATIGSNNDNRSSDDPKPSTSTNNPASTPESTVVLDVEKYGNISANELVALVGEPDEISQSTCQGAFEIPCVYYEYSNADTLGEVSFVLVNDQVVRFTSYSEYPYESKDTVLAQFGITKESSCAVAADTNVALRYRCPSAKVDDFWINLIDGDTFEFLQITYDMEYYEEWYLPLTSSEEIEYKTDAELTMKSLLTSPKTADFPWYDWEYGKNLFYILVSSYVDSENAFGVEMRNTFTFVYSRLTDDIVLAIVNDEVVANNGYVAVDELVQQLYDEMKKAADENKQPNNTTQSNPSDKDNSSKPNDSQSGNSEETPTTQPNNSSDKPTTPHTHSYSSWKYYDEARHYRPCSSCSESEYEAHKWNSGTTTKTASCTQEGTITYICTVCNAEKYESIPMVEHKWDNGTVTQNATCSKEGIVTYFCSSCVAEKHDSLPKTSHEFDQKVTDTSYLKSRATYTTGSVYYYSCSCGEKGTTTFSLNDRIEWITTDMLREDFNLSAGWTGASELYIWTYNTGIGERGNSYLIYDQMRNGMGESVYEGSYNGVTVRFYVIRHSSHYAFYYDDLVAAGII